MRVCQHLPAGASTSQKVVKSSKKQQSESLDPLQIVDFKSIYFRLVPKKGLEPPHPCEYVDLNHARLPIPPLRHILAQSFQLNRQQLRVSQMLPAVSNFRGLRDGRSVE